MNKELDEYREEANKEIEVVVTKIFSDKIKSIEERLKSGEIIWDISSGTLTPGVYNEFDTTCLCGCNTNFSPTCEYRSEAEQVFNDIIEDLCDKHGYTGDVPVFKFEE